jgi:hypothetical protein
MDDPHKMARTSASAIALICLALLAYGLAWNEPPLPNIVMLALGPVGTASGLLVQRLTARGVQDRRLASLSLENQAKVLKINRQAIMPMVALAFSILPLVFADLFRSHTNPVLYRTLVLVLAATSVASAGWCYRLRLAEERIYKTGAAPR